MNLLYVHVMNHLIDECSELEIHQCMGDGGSPLYGLYTCGYVWQMEATFG